MKQFHSHFSTMLFDPGSYNALLPSDLQVFQRGWLSSNNILFLGKDHAALVDSGYMTHQDQTLALVCDALKGRPLNHLVNTHLHSDHCGGNHRLQMQFPELNTWVPARQFEAVRQWDMDQLSYQSTGQSCERFECTHALLDGQEIVLGDHVWQVFAAPGHDPDSVILFQPEYRCLISADALWEQGFGVVFPELEGESAFHFVGQSLDLIASLSPQCVIPGHGALFTDVSKALTSARNRLQAFQTDPGRHMKHAAKVLLKFKLMELQQEKIDLFVDWAVTTRLIQTTLVRYVPQADPRVYVRSLLLELQAIGALEIDAEVLLDRS